MQSFMTVHGSSGGALAFAEGVPVLFCYFFSGVGV